MKIIQVGILALALFLLWVVLSGFFDAYHLLLGILSVTLVIAAVWKLSLFPRQKMGADVWTSLAGTIRWRYGLVYPFIFALNVIKANLQVAALVLDPRMPIDPVLLRFKSTYKTDAAKVLLGNAITLTPGTVTLDIRDQDFYVHAAESSPCCEPVRWNRS